MKKRDGVHFEIAYIPSFLHDSGKIYQGVLRFYMKKDQSDEDPPHFDIRIEELPYLIEVLKRVLKLDFDVVDEIISNFYVSKAIPDPEGYL